MLKLESLKAGMSVKGLLAGAVVKVIAATPALDGSFATVVYQTEGSGGQGPQYGQAMLYRSQEPDLEEAASGSDFSGDPDRFKLAVEAKRIQLAYLFDPMMAVSSSAVMPLPHQITAVYEAMLPKQPIRFLLADDPGAGKTIMAGLLIKELAMRGDAQRVLIVAPGSLAAQWQDELREKFGLAFEIFSRAKLEEAGGGNPFKSSGFWIVRLDQFSRTEPVNYQGLVSEIDWDLVVIDEAHKVAAHYNGKKVEKTQRFKFAELLSRCSRHFLMMTATPHNGKEEDFQRKFPIALKN